ncbi:hypothetical protein I79_011339 [Cricetulus griseus]|uniref:Uncharacterized protein n=1 Tax=Cricetulus griseus TaxID=10029 RepID=G3HKV7_CRIGR|nr:hypothetical protein I79_011339 [Cricetulus griseus]
MGNAKTPGSSVSKMTVSKGIPRQLCNQSKIDILPIKIQACCFDLNWQPSPITRISCFHPFPGARLRLKLFSTVFIIFTGRT